MVQAHLRASPKKSALLGALALVLVVLVVRQVGGGPAPAGASPALVPAAATIALQADQPPAPNVPLPTVPLPPLPREMVRNPFAVDLSLFEVVPGQHPPAQESQDSSEDVDPVTRALEGLTLQSTVIGSTSMAMVNGTVVRVGDQTHGFAVRRIGARFIVLSHGDREFVLTMD